MVRALQGALLDELQSSGVLLEVVSSKPVERVHGEESEEHLVVSSKPVKRQRCDGAGAAAQDAAADQQLRFWGAAHLQECTSACERALDCSVRTGAEPSRHIHRLIVFNLFALEGDDAPGSHHLYQVARQPAGRRLLPFRSDRVAAQVALTSNTVWSRG